MKKILICIRVPEEALEKYKDRYEFAMPPKDKGSYTTEDVLPIAPQYDAIISHVRCKMQKELIDACPNLKVIGSNGVGFDQVDAKYAGEKGIPVINTPMAVMDPTAELALTLLLNVSRGIYFFDKRVRTLGNSSLPSFGTDVFNFARTPHGKTLGIVGFGRIGKTLARKAKAALDMNIIYYDPFKAPPEVEAELDAKQVDLETLLKTSDYVSIHCPYIPENHHLIGEKEFSLMKETAFLINAARGPIVDEAALVRALEEKQIAGAGLDVYENEPQVTKELFAFDNVILTPHIGTYTFENRSNMLQEVIGGVTAVLEGTDPAQIPNIANRAFLR